MQKVPHKLLHQASKPDLLHPSDKPSPYLRRRIIPYCQAGTLRNALPQTVAACLGPASSTKKHSVRLLSFITSVSICARALGTSASNLASWLHG